MKITLETSNFCCICSDLTGQSMGDGVIQSDQLKPDNYSCKHFRVIFYTNMATKITMRHF